MCRFALIERSCFKPYPLAGVFNFWCCTFIFFVVSSHTPLRGYSYHDGTGDVSLTVSSHTPLRGYSAVCTRFPALRSPFQVIPPCGGIRHRRLSRVYTRICFKSYPLAGVFRNTRRQGRVSELVSSHTPLRGYSMRLKDQDLSAKFQVIPPCGGILISFKKSSKSLRVSSHTPLRGYSTASLCTASSTRWFQVIPPCGGIPAAASYSVRRICGFQVIPPCGGILITITAIIRISIVSSHTPLRGYSQTP